MSKWRIERIPDQDSLFYRIHKNWVDDAGELMPGVFCDTGPGMSVDWCKYSTAAEALQRAKSPQDNGVIELRAGAVRALPNQEVSHTPSNLNRAHSEIIGHKNPGIRLKYCRIYQWEITTA